MPIISFSNLGAYGIVLDKAPSEIPLEAWSFGKNVRFTVHGVERTGGSQNVLGTPIVEPLRAYYTAIGANTAWSYWGNTKAYSTDGILHYDITRAVGGDYVVDPIRKWNGGNFNGLVIANNGYDVPQVWAPTTFADKAVDMANWPATLRCGIMRPFGSVLVAMNLTDAGIIRPTALRWSHPADPGSVPPSWDITDSTKDAGEWYLNETTGKIVDLVSLQNDGIVYKVDSMYRMQYIGGPYIYKFQKISTLTGIPAAHCAVEASPGIHILWTGDDVVRFDGQVLRSVASGTVRRIVQNVQDSTYESVFMLNHTQKSEVWICWPEDPPAPYQVMKALILNIETGAWGLRDLAGGFNSLTIGPIKGDAPNDSWAADANPWASPSDRWVDFSTPRYTARILGCTPTNLTQEDFGNTIAGMAYESYVERTALGIPFRQDKPPDISTWKFCRAVYPRISGDPGVEVQVTLGTMAEVGSEVSWGVPTTFVVGTDTKVNCTISGRLFAIRFRSLGVKAWTLHGYDLDVQAAGGF